MRTIIAKDEVLGTVTKKAKDKLHAAMEYQRLKAKGYEEVDVFDEDGDYCDESEL